MAYIPKQGDIIYIEFNPQAGHEQCNSYLNLSYNSFLKMPLTALNAA